MSSIFHNDQITPCPNCNPVTLAAKLQKLKESLENGPWTTLGLIKSLIEIIIEIEKRPNFIPLTVPNGGLTPNPWPSGGWPYPQQPTTVPNYPNTPSYPIITCVNSKSKSVGLDSTCVSIPDATGGIHSDENSGPLC